MPTFDAGDFLQNELGLTFQGVDPSGDVLVRDAAGNSKRFDLQGYAKNELKLDLGKMDYTLNKPETALPESPVSAVDRAKLSLGNASGQVNFLKSRFKDVKQTEQGLAVKDRGVWKQVDPSFFDNPWEVSKDIADWAGDVLPVAGAIGGASVAGPAGAVGGAGAGAAVKTSLGRIVGTYQATPKEQVKDVGIEMALALGGEGIAKVGQKYVLPQVAKALKNVGEKAPQAVKELYANVVGRTTGVGPQAMMHAIDEPAVVSKKLSELAAFKSTEAVDNFVMNKNQVLAKNFLEEANRGLTEQYGKGLESLFQEAEKKNLSADIGGIVSQAFKNIEESGLGKIATTKSGKTIVRPFTDAERADRVAKGLGTEAVLPQSIPTIQSFVDAIQPFSKLKGLQGKAAAQQIQLLNKSVNAIKRSPDPQLRRVAAVADKGIKDGISGVFDKAGLSDKWGQLASLYSQNDRVIKESRRLLASPTGIGAFMNQLMSESLAGKRAQGTAAVLAKLGGQKAERQLKEILSNETARRMTSWLPRMGLWSGGTSLAGAAGALTGSGVGAGALAATSPRLMGNISMSTVKYGRNALDFVKSLPKPQLDQLLTNPDAFRTLVQVAGAAGVEEDQMTQALMDQATQGMGQ